MSTAAICVAGFLISASVAFGYALEGPLWQQSTVNFQVHFDPPPAVLKDGSLDFNKDFENAMASWNEQLARFQFTWTEFDSIASFHDGDGTTQASMQQSVYGQAFGGDGTLAVTIVRSNGSQMLETDIVFNANRMWNSYRGFAGTNAFDFHRVALHELGHALGLDHPDQHGQNVAAIMNSTVSGADCLQTDDVQGAQSLYGRPSSAPPTTVGFGHVANISTRVQVGTDAHVMIGGFIITDAAKPVLVRAIGPSLTAAGVTGALADPVVELHDGTGAIIATNNNWKDNPSQAQQIAATGIAPRDDRESAIYAMLSPGNYTAVVSGNGGTTGVALVEVYDLALNSGRLANISTRGVVGTDDNVLIGGFILSGPQSVRVVVRGLGLSLSSSIPDALGDPTLELHNANGDLVNSDDDWQTQDSDFSISDSGLAPKNSKESALVSYLSPGNFTAVVRGKSNTSGVGLVEVYDIGPPDGEVP